MRTRPRPRRDVDGTQALMLQQPLNTINVIGVAYGNATMESIRAHDHGHTYRRLSRVGALSLGNQVALGNSPAPQVIVADAALAEAGIGGSTTCRDDHWGDALPKKLESVIEAGAQDRRGTARILRSAEYDDSIRRVKFLQRSLMRNANAGQHEVRGQRRQ